jgi:antitoxin component HigA of HigAB toxin-antitoxin module
VRIDVDVTADTEYPTERVIQAIERHTLTDVVVAVVVTIATEIRALFSYQMVRSALQNAGVAHIARIVLETPEQKQQRITTNEHTGDIPDPVTALRQYLEKQNHSVTELAALMELGTELIAARDEA